jgi:hypothetical protein
MRKTIPLLLIAALVVTSCGRVRDSRLNPFNWFGRAESREIVAAGERNPLIPRRSMLAPSEQKDTRSAIGRITQLQIERVPTGAVIRAEGISDRQGAYELGLRPIEGEEVPEGTLRFAFVGYQPPLAVGSETSRRVVAATKLSTQDLQSIRRIEVVGANNVMSARR